jgi:hypothetical protein
LDTGHTYDKIENTMDIIRIGQKGKYLNTLEKYYIYKTNKIGLQMTDTNIDEHNPIFEELHKLTYPFPTPLNPPPPTQKKTYKYSWNHSTIYTISPKVKVLVQHRQH